MNFFSFTRQGIEELFSGSDISIHNIKPFMRYIYKKALLRKLTSLEAAVGPSVERKLKANGLDLSLPGKVVSTKVSRYDQSVKLVIEFEGNAQIESVFMPEKGRVTLCISSQVGCGQGCVFCHTGRMGLKRNLTSSEIVAQVIHTLNFVNTDGRYKDVLEKTWIDEASLSELPVNIVFMGMGEPCDNPEHVVSAVKVMNDPWALEIAPRRITISTAGHLDGLKYIEAKLPQANIALSIHSFDSRIRSRVMPINKRYPLQEILSHVLERYKIDRKVYMIQYTLIAGVNDGKEDALSLTQSLDARTCKINLIPLNAVSVSALKEPDVERIEKFRDILHKEGFRVMIRYSKGQDIAAACGQLVKN